MSKKNKKYSVTKKPFYKKIWFWVLVVIVLSSAFLVDDEVKDDQDEEPKVEQEMILEEENKKDESKKEKDEIEKEQTKKVEEEKAEKEENDMDQESINYTNEQLEEHLLQNKGWALGTIDENANEIENGTPNIDYANWLYVSSITYDGQNVEVQVTADFKDFSETDKNEIASSAQGMTSSYANLSSRPFVTISNGDTVYGRSKVLSVNEYKWSE